MASNGMMIDEVINCKGLRRKRSWPTRGTIPAFTWRDWGNSRHTSVIILAEIAEFRTEHLGNICLDRYGYISPLGYVDVLWSNTWKAFIFGSLNFYVCCFSWRDCTLIGRSWVRPLGTKITSLWKEEETCAAISRETFYLFFQLFFLTQPSSLLPSTRPFLAWWKQQRICTLDPIIELALRNNSLVRRHCNLFTYDVIPKQWRSNFL
jgi:hypothetical protein